jgi:hypothetical protein
MGTAAMREVITLELIFSVRYLRVMVVLVVCWWGEGQEARSDGL